MSAAAAAMMGPYQTQAARTLFYGGPAQVGSGTIGGDMPPPTPTDQMAGPAPAMMPNPNAGASQIYRPPMVSPPYNPQAMGAALTGRPMVARPMMGGGMMPGMRSSGMGFMPRNGIFGLS